MLRIPLALAACLAIVLASGAGAAQASTLLLHRGGSRDKQPNGGTNVVDCNDYGNLSTAGNTVNGNFALPSNDWLTLANWQAHNGHGWDADSAVGGFSANCPSGSIS